MEVITIESDAYRELSENIRTIAGFITAYRREREKEREEETVDNSWVDSYEVCTFLKISKRTLQRLRARNEVNYSLIRGKTFYKINEIRRLLDERLIHRSEEHLQDLIKNHQLHVEQRRTLKADE
jgi:hypothetical protein